eukprot:scaffold1006_cov270-Pinguiococcus_pyrenoidosus.AAC.21
MLAAERLSRAQAFELIPRVFQGEAQLVRLQVLKPGALQLLQHRGHFGNAAPDVVVRFDGLQHLNASEGAVFGAPLTPNHDALALHDGDAVQAGSVRGVEAGNALIPARRTFRVVAVRAASSVLVLGQVPQLHGLVSGGRHQEARVLGHRHAEDGLLMTRDRAQLLAGVHVPQLGGPVSRRRHDQAVLDEDLDAEDPVLVACEGADLLRGLEVPKLRDLVVASGDHEGVVDVDGEDPSAVAALENAMFLAGAEVPHDSGLVCGGRGEELVIGGDADAPDPVLMALELAHFLSGVEIPELDGLVKGRGDHMLVVGGDRHERHQVPMAAEGVHILSSLHVPQLGVPVVGAGGHRPARVRRHGHAVHRVVVAAKRHELLATVRVPQLGGVVFRAGQNVLSIGGDAHAIHARRVAFEDALWHPFHAHLGHLSVCCDSRRLSRGPSDFKQRSQSASIDQRVA